MADQADSTITDRFVMAEDGLRLHLRDYAPAPSHDPEKSAPVFGSDHAQKSPAALPALCLPGLTRTAADFDVLARALSSDAERPRRVLAMDSRGRGLSDRDPEIARYNVVVEARDVVTAMAALGVARAIIIGSSRGGLVALTLPALRPELLAGVAFNDIGPVLEMEGLLRIASYAGKMAAPADFAEGAAMLKRLFGAQFPALTDAEWLAWAERNWTAENGRLIATCDPAVAASLGTIDPSKPLPALWEAFENLPAVPLMVIRGEYSDLLSPQTVEEMRARRNGLTSVEVGGQGHTPLLADVATIGTIADFAARCDAANAAS